jgi:hypothetical protein
MLFAFLIILCCLNTQCDDDDFTFVQDDVLFSTCDEEGIIIDEVRYNTLMNESFTVESAEIIEDCIIITIGASGCSSENWEFDLIDSNLIAESSPVQRSIKLDFINPEACLAAFTKTLIFDLSQIRVVNETQVRIHIDGFNDTLLYIYGT